MYFVQHEEIKEVTGNFFRRNIPGIEVEFFSVRKWRENPREKGFLYLPGNTKFTFHRFFCFSRSGQVRDIMFQVIGHFVECFYKLMNFIMPPNTCDLLIEIALGYFIGKAEQSFYRFCDAE